MPYEEIQNFRTPWWQIGGDLQTAYPGLFRKLTLNGCQQLTVPTPDGDELWLDHYRNKSDDWVILCHGLEGDSRRPYMLGMARALLAEGKQVVAWNYRSCGGRLNLRPEFYHSGATADLEVIVQWVSSQAARRIFLVGFSLGGNLVMKYLGEQDELVQNKITAAAAISVPTDLAGSSHQLDGLSGWPYRSRFLATLKAKVREKAKRFPLHFELDKLDLVANLRAFDDAFTAPLHGFKDAADYYTRCSSKAFIPAIKRPCLLLQAWNDPFLSRSCFPIESCARHPHVQLEISRTGGHVGFMQQGSRLSWPEIRIPAFFRQCE